MHRTIYDVVIRACTEATGAPAVPELGDTEYEAQFAVGIR